MRSVIISIIMIISMCSTVFANETIMWYLRDGGEVIQYTVDVNPQTVGTEEMNRFNHALRILANSRNYSNLIEFEQIVNKSLTGDIRDFRVIDVVVDER